jgi:hypothetical protein
MLLLFKHKVGSRRRMVVTDMGAGIITKAKNNGEIWPKIYINRPLMASTPKQTVITTLFLTQWSPHKNARGKEKKTKNKLSIILTEGWVVLSAAIIFGSAGRYRSVDSGGNELISASIISMPLFSKYFCFFTQYESPPRQPLPSSLF